MTYYNKNVTVLVICRSRSQSNNEFDSFLSNLEKILSDINNPKPALPIITGNLMQDLSSGGLPIVILQRNPSCLHYLHEMFFSQLINKPAHMQTNSTSCTDLFFTDKLGLSAYSGIHHRYTQIVITKLFTLLLILIFATPTISTTSMVL